jgi:putative flippase GtrA
MNLSKSLLIRWAKFIGVGALGMGVQLGSLAVLNHWMRPHYLIASALALEITLLHNFVWHLHFTWRGREDRGSWQGQLMRHQLSSGVVSMVGNLVLMRLLVQGAHLPVVLSNAIAILACSLLNFSLAEFWAFAARRRVGSAVDDKVRAGVA